MNEPSPWIPETNKLKLASLGKLAEELNECAAIVSRCIIQGIDEAEPTSGKINKSQLEDEIADVKAQIDQAIFYLNLNFNKIAERRSKKRIYIMKWIDTLVWK